MGSDPLSDRVDIGIKHQVEINLGSIFKNSLID